eukprot:symbB.v1.2.018187.t1/scaffold1440.1/size119446/2
MMRRPHTNAGEVERDIKMAREYLLLGNYEASKERYEAVLALSADQLVAALPDAERPSAMEKFERVQHGLKSEVNLLTQILDTWKDLGTVQMIQINVALLNGNPELFTLLPSSTVQDVRTKAQRAFGKKHLKLITAKNRVLVNFEQTLEEAEIEDGECLTALVLQPKLAATRGAFALWCHEDSAIVTWADAEWGGDSSEVRDQLRGVQQIQATDGAFAAILSDGSIVTWGNPDYGGDSSTVRDQLKGVMQIQATGEAFAAILEDGSVVTWGDARYGGDSSAVQDELKGVQQIQSTYGAFAAILSDGSVVTWGDRHYGGDSSAVQDQLKGVEQIQATRGAFAAILEDRSVVTWGDRSFGGDSSAVRGQLRGVQQIQAATCAFAAILADGSVAAMLAFAVIREDGSVVTWGHADSGGDSSAVREQLDGV